MVKTSEIHLHAQQDNLFIRLVKDFFNPNELWGRQNRNQFLMGLICTIGYFFAITFFNINNPDWNPYYHTSNGLIITVLICIGLILARFTMNLFKKNSSQYPWYEKYMAQIITLLGLITLIALQNLNSTGTFDAALWIDIIVLLVVFIIAAGFFVEGSSHERALKIWFALLGYYFSIVGFFYFLEALVNT